MRHASISIDLDGLDLYHAIHGLPLPPADANPIYELALPRFLELFDELGVPSTLFVVTRYLERAETVTALRTAAGAGHELASHTHDHPYDLSRMGARDVGFQLDEAADQLERHFGVRPTGFRTPGYNLSDTIVDCLVERGYRYDSSVFPCPPYYLAKGAVMAGMRLTGRRSGSSMTDPRTNLAPIRPYRPARGAFWRRDRRGETALWEIPMCVLPGVRFWVIGTTLALMGARGFAAIYPVVRGTHELLNLEFHGIDLLGPGDPGVTDALLAKQPDLRVPVAKKRAIYADVFRRVLDDYAFVTLDAAARALR